MLNAELKSFLRLVFNQIVLSVKPKELIRSELKISNNKLLIHNKEFTLNNNCFVAGFGKAVYEMGCEVEEILKNHVNKGILIVPHNSLTHTHQLATNIKYKVFQGAKNNMPDSNSYHATQELIDYVKPLKEGDILLVLISGGGSALLTCPLFNISLEEKIKVIKLLAHSGADIKELNTVRKQLSAVKGGRLAGLAYPSQVVSVILSDVINDPLDMIASGPTVQNPDRAGSGYAILEKYDLLDKVSEQVINFLKDFKNDIDPKVFNKSETFIIGNNSKALNAGRSFIEKKEKVCCVMTTCLEGSVKIISESFVEFTKYIAQYLQKVISLEDLKCSMSHITKHLHISEENFETFINILSQGTTEIFLLFGSETTVVVEGMGKGGRNMELVLRYSQTSYEVFSNTNFLNNITVAFMSAGTDGIDGPTDSAGAFAYPGQVASAKSQGLEPESFISNNDSYHFFKNLNNGNDLIVTGHTGTNVMDVAILYIKKND